MATSNYAKSIVLPFDEVFRNLKNAKRFAIDIGGSLAKLAYSSTIQKKSTLLFPYDTGSNGNSLYEVSETRNDGIRLHFIKFETRYIENCLEFIQQKQETCGLQDDSTTKQADHMPTKLSKIIKTTGGGAHKYFDLISEKLKLRVDKEDEMECLIKGCNFLLRNIPDQSFTFHYHDAVQYRFQTVDPCHVFPYLLVNIGSGVSIVKVDSDERYQRVGGTSFGGGSFWGLGSLLTKARGFDELLKLAEEGDHRNVDMLVADIYGGAYDKLGLPGDLIASSFGKMIHKATNEQQGTSDIPAKESDIARSLLLTISNCIGQIAVLYASMHQLKRIYFGGYFIRGHPITMRTISYAINYWSKGEIQALFLRHEGYLGAVGAFLKGAEEDSKPNAGSDTTALYSWKENYAGSSGLGSSVVPAAFLSQNGNALMSQLEMDCAQQNLVPCPLLLSAESYTPDSVDLTQDNEARDYWLTCLEEGVEKTVKKAVDSQLQNLEDAKERASHFRHRYVQHLKLLRQHPFAYGCLNLRSLLDLNEQLLNEYYFPDAYHLQKRLENEQSLREVPALLSKLDDLDWEERQMALCTGLIAGNVFDWGAQAVVFLMEAKDGFSFEKATEKVQKRPWLCDDYDLWMKRLSNGKPHECACIFVDNSGADIVLGIFPFARELLKKGTKIILCANSKPALNDVTFDELELLKDKMCKICPVINRAVKDRRLIIAENGQASPCLDLSRIDGSLAKLIIDSKVDLIMIEGMGRAIHTNYEAKFNCESLKVAVLKNQWLASRLGGEVFSVIFKYENVPTLEN